MLSILLILNMMIIMIMKTMQQNILNQVSLYVMGNVSIYKIVKIIMQQYKLIVVIQNQFVDGSTTDEELVQSDNDFSEEEKKDDHNAYRPVSAAHDSKRHGKSSQLSSPHPFKDAITSSRSLSSVEHEQQIRSVGSETPRAQNTSKDKLIFFGDDVCIPSLSKVDIPVDEVRPDNVNIEIEQPSATQKSAFRGNFKSYKNFKETKTLRRNKAEPDDLIENSGPIDSDEVMESMKAEIDQKASPAVLLNQKHLKVSSAARNNARTLAYIHSLTGGPSPRSLWKQYVDSEDESSTHNDGTSPSSPPTGSTRILRHRKIKMRKRLYRPQAANRRRQGENPSNLGCQRVTTQEERIEMNWFSRTVPQAQQ